MWRPKDWDAKKIAQIPLEGKTFLDPTLKDVELVEAGADAMLKKLRLKGWGGEFPEGACETEGVKGIMVFIPSDEKPTETEQVIQYD